MDNKIEELENRIIELERDLNYYKRHTNRFNLDLSKQKKAIEILLENNDALKSYIESITEKLSKLGECLK